MLYLEIGCAGKLGLRFVKMLGSSSGTMELLLLAIEIPSLIDKSAAYKFSTDEFKALALYIFLPL